MLLGRHKVNCAYHSMTMIICDGLWEQHRPGALSLLYASSPWKVQCMIGMFCLPLV